MIIFFSNKYIVKLNNNINYNIYIFLFIIHLISSNIFFNIKHIPLLFIFIFLY